MASRYTDVDLMILKRWNDVKALRDAFDDLVDRMRDIVEESLQKVSVALSERGPVVGLRAQAAVGSVLQRRDGRPEGRSQASTLRCLISSHPLTARRSKSVPHWFKTDASRSSRFRRAARSSGKH